MAYKPSLKVFTCQDRVSTSLWSASQKHGVGTHNRIIRIKRKKYLV